MKYKAIKKGEGKDGRKTSTKFSFRRTKAQQRGEPFYSRIGTNQKNDQRKRGQKKWPVSLFFESHDKKYQRSKCQRAISSYATF
jgi:hypothetical protein